MGATYGIPIKSSEDPLIHTAEEVMRVVSLALSPAMWLINPISLGKSLGVLVTRLADENVVVYTQSNRLQARLDSLTFPASALSASLA